MAQKISIGDLLKCRIVTADGKVIGHVADVEISPGPEYRVLALIFGLHGRFYRLHVLNPFRRIGDDERPVVKTIPWEAVASIECPFVRLKSGYDERSVQRRQM